MRRLSAFEHMDILTKTYDKSGAQEVWRHIFGLDEDRDGWKNLSFGDAWALGEAMIAKAWGFPQ